MIPREILKKVHRLEITTRGLVNDVFSGEYHSVFKGRGMEFSEVREYQVGDDIRTIDWNVTARYGKPFVKVFEEERELTVILMVDASSSGEFGSFDRMKGEIGVEICALLAFSAIKNNDKVGLIIFTDQVEKYIPPRKGKSHVLRVLRELLYFKPEDRMTDVGGALEFLNRVARRRSVVFLVSDFLSKDFERPLRIANKKHDLVAVHLVDPRETELPDVGYLELEDAETGERILVDTSDSHLRRLYAETSAEIMTRRDRLFKSMNVD
ncbi:MAG TPA: DUF58 domain-containing protein, partial [bacterium]|nr:DUF58 domain-containing protein [bacterium]